MEDPSRAHSFNPSPALADIEALIARLSSTGFGKRDLDHGVESLVLTRNAQEVAQLDVNGHGVISRHEFIAGYGQAPIACTSAEGTRLASAAQVAASGSALQGVHVSGGSESNSDSDFQFGSPAKRKPRSAAAAGPADSPPVTQPTKTDAVKQERNQLAADVAALRPSLADARKKAELETQREREIKLDGAFFYSRSRPRKPDARVSESDTEIAKFSSHTPSPHQAEYGRLSQPMSSVSSPQSEASPPKLHAPSQLPTASGRKIPVPAAFVEQLADVQRELVQLRLRIVAERKTLSRME
jgi:hypothetical protein